MKKTALVLVLIALITGLHTRVEADSLDQSNATGGTNIGFGQATGIKYSCQGFKPAHDIVTAVAFQLQSTGSQGMLVWVDAANANSFPTGTLEQGLGSLEIPNSQLSTSLTKYTFPTPISVTPEAQYVFCLAPWNTSTHVYADNYRNLNSSVANPYSRGKMSHYSGGSWTNSDSGNADRVFQIFSVQPTWSIQSVDLMKDSKDKMCDQLTQEQIDDRMDKAVELGATHVAIATPYTAVICSGTSIDPLSYTMKFVSSARSHGLKVWHRHPGVQFEGIYSATKATSPDGYRHLKTITDFVALDQTNPTLFEEGDIFTPEAEPQNGGINGLTYCESVCQFSSAADFNEWLRITTLTSQLALAANDITGVSVGYWGFDGFIVWGDNNPDHLGTSKLESATVAAMGNLITIDHYPVGTSTMATDLDEARSVWPTADFFIGEWGTTNGGSTSTLETAVNDAFGAFASRSWIKGVNYWQLGPDGNEALINSDMSNRPHFDEVQDFYK